MKIDYLQTNYLLIPDNLRSAKNKNLAFAIITGLLLDHVVYVTKILLEEIKSHLVVINSNVILICIMCYEFHKNV